MRVESTHKSRRTGTAVTILALLSLGACLLPTDTCACVYPPPHLVVVRGVVHEASGAPAGNVFVRARAFATPCPASDSGDVNVMQGFAPSDRGGAFRIELRTPLALADACVRVRAFRVITDPTPAATVERYPVRFGVDSSGGPMDSVVVTLILP